MTNMEKGSLNAHTMSHILRSLAMQMENAATEMIELAETDNCLLAKHATELVGAAEICREWADNVSTLAVHYKLPSALFCRCRDMACLRHESCLRWLARNQDKGNPSFVAEGTLRAAWGDRHSCCKHFMEPIE